MKPGFYSHTEYWFDNARVRFYPQKGMCGVWPGGYRVIVSDHFDNCLLAINIGKQPRPSRKYAREILEKEITRTIPQSTTAPNLERDMEERLTLYLNEPERKEEIRKKLNSLVFGPTWEGAIPVIPVK